MFNLHACAASAKVKYVNDRQQVVYISNTGRTTEQGPFTKIIWPTTRPGRQTLKDLTSRTRKCGSFALTDITDCVEESFVLFA